MDRKRRRAHIFRAAAALPAALVGGERPMGNRFTTGSMVGAIVAAIATSYLTLHHGLLIGVVGGVAIAVVVGVIASMVIKTGGPPKGD